MGDPEVCRNVLDVAAGEAKELVESEEVDANECEAFVADVCVLNDLLGNCFLDNEDALSEAPAVKDEALEVVYEILSNGEAVEMLDEFVWLLVVRTDVVSETELMSPAKSETEPKELVGITADDVIVNLRSDADVQVVFEVEECLKDVT